MMYPNNRKRRLRKSAALRDLVQETQLHPDDFIVPLFVVEGNGVKQEIPSMPNVFRMSLDKIQKEVRLLWSMGLKGILVFTKVEESLKECWYRGDQSQWFDATSNTNHQRHSPRNGGVFRCCPRSILLVWA